MGDELWTFTRAWLQKHHPDQMIYVGTSPDGPFNRSAAVNDAARTAGDWDVAVICDSDTVVPPPQFDEAVSKAHQTGRLASALTKVVELARQSTDQLLADAETDIRVLTKKRTRTKDDMTQSSVLAVPRDLWDAIGGFDEAFSGWGCEDNAFWKAATVLGGTSRDAGSANTGGGGEPIRIDGCAFHLWHEQASKIKLFDPIFRANFKRLGYYKKLTTPEELGQLRNS